MLCGIARMSCLPEFPVNNGLKGLTDLGRNCIIDISACGTQSPSDSVAVGPGGPDGPLSSSDLAGVLVPAMPVGIPFPVGPAGPVGLDGTLSPSKFISILIKVFINIHQVVIIYYNFRYILGLLEFNVSCYSRDHASQEIKPLTALTGI